MCKTQFVYQSLQFTVVNYKGYDWWLSSWKWKSCAWKSQYVPFSPLEPRTGVPLCKWKCMGGKAFDCWRRIFALIHWKTGQRHSLWNWVTFANLISGRKGNNCKSGIMSNVEQGQGFGKKWRFGKKEGECSNLCLGRTWVKQSNSEEDLISTYMTFLGISNVVHIHTSSETIFISPDQNWDQITRSYKVKKQKNVVLKFNVFHCCVSCKVSHLHCSIGICVRGHLHET